MSRGVSLAAGLALVGVLAYWSWLNLSGALGQLALRDDPAAMDNQPVVLTLVAVGPALSADRYVVFNGAQPIEVLGPSAAVTPGEDVTLGGVFSAADGAIRLQWLDHAPGRAGKKRLGLLSLVFLAGALPALFRLDRDGIRLRG